MRFRKCASASVRSRPGKVGVKKVWKERLWQVKRDLEMTRGRWKVEGRCDRVRLEDAMTIATTSTSTSATATACSQLRNGRRESARSR